MAEPKPSYDDQDSEAADDFIHDLLRQIINESHLRSKDDIVARALFFFLLRAANSWRSIRILSKSATNEKEEDAVAIDAATILRAMYDAYFQAAYVVKQPDQSEQRATDYFEFEHVDRHRRMEALLGHDNWIATSLKASPKHDAGQTNIQQQLDRVKERFTTKKGNIRQHWFPGTLRDVARSLEREDEYDTFLAEFNGCVHTSAFYLKCGPPVTARHVLTMASTIAAKITLLNVDHNKIVIHPTQTRVLDVLCSPAGNRSTAGK